MFGRRALTWIAAWLLVLPQMSGCSISYPIWSKSKQSDTPLFRFVVNEDFGAGYIDREGRIVIPAQYESASNRGGDFFDGLALVTTKGGVKQFIDATGAAIGSTRDFDEYAGGLRPHFLRDKKKWTFVDRNGNRAFDRSYDSVDQFSEGLARVVGGLAGFIDTRGEFAVPPRFIWADAFSDGHAWAIEAGRPCQMRPRGPCLYLPVPVGLSGDQEDAEEAATLLPNCRYSVIDKRGNITLSRNFIDAQPFSEGLAAVSDGRVWGYVDYQGHIKIPLQFEYAGGFSDGLAAVRLGGSRWDEARTGYVDKRGQMVIPARYHSAAPFSEGYAVVEVTRDRYRFIDKNGQQAFPGEFDAASGFVMGLAHVQNGRDRYTSTWSYIDKTGKAVFTYWDESDRGKIKAKAR